MFSKNLVITADDFGYGLERNRGIVECFLEGAVTRASLLVNSVACRDAFDLAQRHRIPVGLHLNLTEGVPVSRPYLIPSLLSERSPTFRGKVGLRDAIDRKAVMPNEIRAEIEAQINAFKDLNGGRMPSFVDGHQHIHIVPGVVETFADVLSSLGITQTRLPADAAVQHCDWMSAQQMNFYSTVVAQCAHAQTCFTQHGIEFFDCFTGITTMGEHMTAAHLQQNIVNAFATFKPRCTAPQNPSVVFRTNLEHKQAQLVNGHCLPAGSSSQSNDPNRKEFRADAVTCELMVHPGYRSRDMENGGCGEGADDFSMSSDREHELEVLCGSDMKQFYKNYNIRLVSR